MGRIPESEARNILENKAKENGMTVPGFIRAKSRIANLTGRAIFIKGHQSVLVEVAKSGDVSVLGSYATIDDASQEKFSRLSDSEVKNETNNDRNYIIWASNPNEIYVYRAPKKPRKTNLKKNPRFNFCKK